MLSHCKCCVLAALLLFASLVAAQGKPAMPSPRQQPAAAAKPKQRRVVPNLTGFELQRGPAGTMTGGASRGASRPVALAPMLAKLYARQPQFEWTDGEAGKQFTFALLNDSLEPVFTSKVDGNHFAYPPSGPALEDGKAYYWTVTGAGGETSIVVGFQVVGDDERKQIAARLDAEGATSSPLKAGQVFTDLRLWYDAIAALNQAVLQHPDDPKPYESRGTVFAQLAATRQQSERDFARADKLASPAK